METVICIKFQIVLNKFFLVLLKLLINTLFLKKKVLCKNQEVHKLLIFHLTLGGSPIRLNFLATFGTFSKAYFFPLDFARSIAL